MRAKGACEYHAVHLLENLDVNDILDTFKGKKHQIQLYNIIMLPVVAVEAIQFSIFWGGGESQCPSSPLCMKPCNPAHETLQPCT